MAIAEFEVDVIVQDGQPIPVVPPASLDSEDVEGLQYDEDGERQGGFQGWADGELVRLYEEIANGNTEGLRARVILKTSEDKLVEWHNNGYDPGDETGVHDMTVMNLTNGDAQNCASRMSRPIKLK
jgi:hypothetical protein